VLPLLCCTKFSYVPASTLPSVSTYQVPLKISSQFEPSKVDEVGLSYSQDCMHWQWSLGPEGVNHQPLMHGLHCLHCCSTRVLWIYTVHYASSFKHSYCRAQPPELYHHKVFNSICSCSLNTPWAHGH
jgi:hypothetical protein